MKDKYEFLEIDYYTLAELNELGQDGWHAGVLTRHRAESKCDKFTCGCGYTRESYSGLLQRRITEE